MKDVIIRTEKQADIDGIRKAKDPAFNQPDP